MRLVINSVFLWYGLIQILFQNSLCQKDSVVGLFVRIMNVLGFLPVSRSQTSIWSNTQPGIGFTFTGLAGASSIELLPLMCGDINHMVIQLRPQV